jgi:hypothetical protein
LWTPGDSRPGAASHLHKFMAACHNDRSAAS